MSTPHTLPTHPDCFVTGMLVDYKHGEPDSATFAVYQTDEGTWRAAFTTDAAERRRMEKREEKRYGRRDEEFWLGPDHAIPITSDADFRTCNFCGKPVRGIWYYERRRPWIYRGERIHNLIAWAHTRCARTKDSTNIKP